ncbi:hypothetical protein [Poritiphilus flavus]|uniref:Oxygen tolerance n=1 Tax=Poritiphilus flavus TaxID=2697053 RepID=A0A6L9ECY4_9FLAO|nr:hypothetical protein [Poritiphilus flavus]NAS12491.1 hypothetical protein [Poritiphilus flavus]
MRTQGVEAGKIASHFLRYSLLWLCLVSAHSYGQKKPVVSSEADTTSIKIGEQIKFKVVVEADSTAQVIFPEGQTFAPLETVEAYKTDTTRKKDRITLQKTYALTQFDSGTYKLPTQRIEIDGIGYFTDSLEVQVATVPVDTLTQKMYDIKPLMEVQKSYSDLLITILIVLLILGVIAGLVYWFVLRKKPLTEEEKEAMLPAYDRALLELKRLENSKYLIQDEYKKYYSELTAIVRAYLEEDVHVSALESTTNQLIDKLELLKDSGELQLEEETIQQFKKILQTADLVKFARSKPPTSVAEQDRLAVEQIVIKTKEALPEPTEEELMMQEAYQEEMAEKRRKKKIYIAAASFAGLVFFALAFSIAYYGFSTVKDSVFGHPTKSLLEGEWVSSAYGYPPIIVETPEVLIRQETELSAEAMAKIKELQVFSYEQPKGMFTVGAISTTYTDPEELNFEESVEAFIINLEKRGVKNIITKEEEFTTLSGVKGVRIYGSAKFPVNGSDETKSGKYSVILFGGKGFQQQLMLSWLEDDDYAQEIIDRIMKSIEVKTEV